MLCQLKHRRSQAGDLNTGDGVGILAEIPHLFFKKACSQVSIKDSRSNRYHIASENLTYIKGGLNEKNRSNYKT
ncbi:hypothetical protein AC625_24595 [Peribacillus loiseleuriae]|uniref:Glutamine amidotransferase type-2 domain-containing protein n=2 Tax=Peribacillus loiseleuriae TaxID=1679170 RepID=A0A0K9G8S7_9BACI|nr:hypothetical protein AC625_24595 [Peribacillus loiseleuriae]